MTDVLHSPVLKKSHWCVTGGLVEGSYSLGMTLLVGADLTVNNSWKNAIGGFAKFIRSFKSRSTAYSVLSQVILTVSNNVVSREI